MKKRLIPICALGLVGVLTACTPAAKYDQVKGLEDGTLGYVLCIGDVGHNDSKARTQGIREALGTWDGSTDPNTSKEGSINIGGKTYKVKELAAKEMKNNTGSTWDQATATDMMGTWANQFKNELDLVVSNNDGMAMGCLGNGSFIEGMPIFGYDANPDAIEAVIAGKLTGTVSQSVQGQAAGTLMALRNLLDGKDVATSIKDGFTVADEQGNKVSSPATYRTDEKALMFANSPVNKANAEEHRAGVFDKGIEKKEYTKKKVLLNIYNAGDNFLSASYLPALEEYAKRLNLELTVIQGDGNNESSVLEKFIGLDSYDGYAINMVKTNGGPQYTEKLGGVNKDKPVVFFNRQPSDPNTGAIDMDTMNHNDKTIYVGFDAPAGGGVQGKLITDYYKDLKL